MTIIIDNIITPYEIARYNEINKAVKGALEVWFQNEAEVNRLWTHLPKIEFKYRLLNRKPFHLEIIPLLNKYRNRIDRVVCCGWNSCVYFYAFWFCKKNKIRLTLWSGSTIYDKSLLRMISLPLVKFIVRRTDDCIAYGTRAKEYLIRLGAREDKIKIFLNSVDVDYFHGESLKLKKDKYKLREKYNITTTDTVFVFVGQLIDRKGLIELIHGFAKASAENKSITLVIVGKGKLREEIDLFIKNHPEVKIKLLGYIEYNILPEVYAVSDVLILPSKEEVWGLVVNEALASGIPTIVSKFAGCTVDLIDKSSGEIIKEISADSIADILRKFLRREKYIISPKLLNKMRNANYIRNNFI